MKGRWRQGRLAGMRSTAWVLLLAACSGQASRENVPDAPAPSAEVPASSAAEIETSARAPGLAVSVATASSSAPPVSSASASASASAPATASASASAEQGPAGTQVVSPSPGLEIRDIKVGKGRLALRGTTLKVHYVGTLADGREFDSSRSRKEPFRFELGKGHVIRGWEEGIIGMRVGGIRRLVIGPQLAYGARGAPPTIPPGATLTFEVELLEVR